MDESSAKQLPPPPLDPHLLDKSLDVEASDLEAVRTHLLRLIPDLHHHQQRMNDLVYDAVGMDVGGSE